MKPHRVKLVDPQSPRGEFSPAGGRAWRPRFVSELAVALRLAGRVHFPRLAESHDRFGGGQEPGVGEVAAAKQNLQPSEVDPSLDRGCRRGHTPRVVRARSTLATLLAASRDRVPGTDSRAWVAQGQWRIGRQPTRPVLKHGPRSLTYVQVQRWQTCVHNESNSGWIPSGCTIRRPTSFGRKV